MTSLAVTILDLPMLTGLKTSLGSQDEHELLQRDDVFFSLMQEPEAATPQREQEPLRQTEKTSKEEPAEKNDIICDLDKSELEERTDLLSHISQDTHLKDFAFPKEWKGITKEDISAQETVEKFTPKLSVFNPTEEAYNDLIPQIEELVVAGDEAPTIEVPLSKSDKYSPDTRAKREPSIKHTVIQSAQESVPFETDLLKKSQPIDQEEKTTPFPSDKKLSDKKEDVILKFDPKNPENNTEDVISSNNKKTENTVYFNAKTKELNDGFILTQKDPLPSFESSPSPRSTSTVKKNQEQKTLPVTAFPISEKKSFANLSTTPTLGAEKSLFFEALNDQNDEPIVNFAIESRTDKKIPSSETSKPVENAKFQEDISETLSYKAVALDIKMPSKEIPGSLKLRLDPAHLGRVEVKVHITHDGRMDAVVSVVKSETFELLQKDASALHKVIAEAFGQDESSMSFSLTGGEKNPSHDFFSPPQRHMHTQNNLEIAPGDQTLSYNPKPLDPARMLDALV